MKIVIKKINVYVISALFVLVLLVNTANSTGTVTIYGKVENDSQNSVSEAKIIVQTNKQTQNHTYTDNQGNYSITLDIDTYINHDVDNSPEDFALFQNYPNPFNPHTKISFKLPHSCYVKINIYNLLGQKIFTLANDYYSTGLTTLGWAGMDKWGKAVSTGIYFYRIETKFYTSTKKMLLMDGGFSNTISFHPYRESHTQKSTKTKKNSQALNIEKFIVEKEGFHDYYERNYVIDTEAGSINKNIKLVNQDSVRLFVIEKDRLLGGFVSVDNYHNTFIINTNPDSIIINVESPTPDTLKRESILSPAFGLNAFFNYDYSKHFDIPNIQTTYLANEPDTSTTESHFWDNLKLGPYDGIHVPYSSYRGQGEQLYIKDLGVNKFFDLKVISDYSIIKNITDTTFLDIQIIQTMQNTGPDTLFWVGVVLHIPKELNTKPVETNLYNLITDTVICDIRYEYAEDWGRLDGFSMGASGQEITTRKDTLLPYQSYNFTYQMTIEPLLDKFEIYPMYQIIIETKGYRIWPGSIISFDNNRYRGPVQYLKVCGLAIPTYILFAIDGDDLKVVSPDDIEPTF